MKPPSQYPVIMIVLNDVEHDNRVLKCAQHLELMGYPVTIFGVSNTRDQDKPVLQTIAGLNVRLFPNPRFMIKNAPDRYFNWEATITHLIAAMWAHFDEAGPAILHTHDFNALKIGRELLLSARRNGAAIYWVHDFHEYVAGLTTINGEIRKAGLAHQDESIRIPDQLITVSPQLSDALQRDYGLRSGPAVILNSNSLTCYDPGYRDTIRGKLGLAASIPLAVYAGGVSAPRGVHTLVEALRLIPEMHVALVTNNSGGYVESLKAIAEKHNAADRFHLLPYVPPAEAPSFIQDATVGVHPMVHFENAEVALPNKLFDYCLARLPCVVSDCKAMSGFVREWGIGEVFRAEDVEDLARALQNVFADPDRYTEPLRGHSPLLKAISWEAQSSRLDAIYSRARTELERADADDNWFGLLCAPAPSMPAGIVMPHHMPGVAGALAEPPQLPFQTTQACTGELLRVDGNFLVGWAEDKNDPARPLKIELLYRDEKMCECRTGLALPDALPYLGPNCGFKIPLPRSFLDGKARKLTLRIVSTGVILKGTPVNVAVPE